MQCDFKDQSSKSALVKREECSERCSQSIDCTHFVWTKYKGGTCWMKSGNVSSEDAFKTGDKTMLCGILLKVFSPQESHKIATSVKPESLSNNQKSNTYIKTAGKFFRVLSNK